MGSLLLAAHAGCLLDACLQFARSWLGAHSSLLDTCLLGARSLIAADGCLLMQELLLDFLPIYEAFAFIVELKA